MFMYAYALRITLMCICRVQYGKYEFSLVFFKEEVKWHSKCSEGEDSTQQAQLK